MATTTFTGPIKAGSVINTTGTAANGKMKNVGSVLMTQVSAKTSHDDTSTASAGIVIPANSFIFGIEVYVNELFANSNGSSTVLDVGTSADGDYFVDGLALSATATTALGGAAAAARWINVGTSDVEIYANMETGNATAGELYFVVSYIQNANVS